MSNLSLSEALTREHHVIDAGIEAFVADLDQNTMSPESLLSPFVALKRHIYLEDEFLFPPIKQAGVLMPVLVMLREHGELWQVMDAITELLENPSSKEVNEELTSMGQELLARLDQHNSKEEPLIYPHAETDLSEDAISELAAFMQSGAMPADWICEALR